MKQLVKIFQFLGVFLATALAIIAVVGAIPGTILLGVYLYQAYDMPPELYILIVFVVVVSATCAWTYTYGDEAKAREARKKYNMERFESLEGNDEGQDS